MGASLSWFAVRGKAPEKVLQEFGLTNVGKTQHKTPYCGAMLPSGWFLLIHGRHEFSADEVERLSRDCEVIACFVEEHVMVSRAAAWKNSEPIWRVTHDAQQGDEHLEIKGKPPSGFEAIRQRLTRQQEEEEGVNFLFNIPVELAEEVTGYSYDQSPRIPFDNFVKLTFFQRLFRR